VNVLEDRHEQTAKKEVVNANGNNNVSVFRLHEARKARSNELEDTVMEAIIIIIIIIFIIILQLTGSAVTSSDYRDLRL
jgi:t-SNARE complex subunit (syntaxin)